MICAKCNRQIDENFNVCPYCGTPVYRPAPQSNGGSIPRHIFYRERFKTHNILLLVAQILTVVMVISLLFLPIYTAKIDLEDIEIEDLEELDEIFEDEEEFLEALDDGYILRDFSAFDELMVFIDGIMPDEDEEDSEFELESLLMFTDYLFIIFEFVSAIVVLIAFIPNIKSIIDDLSDPTAASLLKYNEIKKSGGTKVRESMFKKQMGMSLVFYALFDVIYALMFSKLYGFYGSSQRMMNHVDSPSIWVAFPLMFVVAYIVVTSIANSTDKKIKVDVLMEQSAS